MSTPPTKLQGTLLLLSPVDNEVFSVFGLRRSASMIDGLG